MVEITPEIQAQLDEQKKNCIFCKIISGEQEGKKVYEDEEIVALLDINPACKGHVLVLPKEHYPIMPYVPPQTFAHMFGLMPKLVKAVNKATITTGVNIVVANGGVAGQKAPHFLVHLLPRECGDGHDIYDYSGNSSHDEKTKQLMINNIPIMMQNHFSRTGVNYGVVQSSDAVYQDSIVTCKLAENPVVNGHMIIETDAFHELSEEQASHLFYVGSYCATAIFEGMGAHGSNIILQSGKSNDNDTGKTRIHVLPRFQDDGIEILGNPISDKSHIDEMHSMIKSETFILNPSPEREPLIINLDEMKKEDDEITKAINKIKYGNNI
ncbi:HIT domain-containing protein [Candidatus Woesearchaeota archaeon]|nr:HIT domain-containing protein [Candidatus Woesearchaeota archaeon]